MTIPTTAEMPGAHDASVRRARCPPWAKPNRSSRRSARTLRRRIGYTLVEVLMALAVLTVGAAGIIAMQKFALGGSLQARHLTAGVNINDAWLERLSTEALVWNSPTNDALNLAQMTTLSTAGALPASGDSTGPWVRLAATTLEGDDADPGAGGGATDPVVAYCTHVRLAWIDDPATSDALRVELRTFWARSGRAIPGECALGLPAASWDDVIADPTRTTTIDGVPRDRHEYGWSFSTGILRRSSQ